MKKEVSMDVIWMFMAGLTVGAVAMKLNDCLVAKEATIPALMAARRRLFHDKTITHDVALAAQKHISDSSEIKRMLDYLVASLSDEANMALIDTNIGPNQALVAAGKVQAAEQMASAIDDLVTGKLVLKLKSAERENEGSSR
jgi:hypothetical protein